MSFLADCETALTSHLTILIHHAVDTPFLHRVRVVDMLRLEGAVLHKQDPHEEKAIAIAIINVDMSSISIIFYNFAAAKVRIRAQYTKN